MAPPRRSPSDRPALVRPDDDKIAPNAALFASRGEHVVLEVQ